MKLANPIHNSSDDVRFKEIATFLVGDNDPYQMIMVEIIGELSGWAPRRRPVHSEDDTPLPQRWGPLTDQQCGVQLVARMNASRVTVALTVTRSNRRGGHLEAFQWCQIDG